MNKIEKVFLLIERYLLTYNTYEIGSLLEIIKILVNDQSFNNYSSIANNIYQLITKIILELETNSTIKGRRIEQYTFLIIDSLIFNLYSKHKPTKKGHMNQSMYQSSKSMTGSQKQGTDQENSINQSLSANNNQQFSLNVGDFNKFMSRLILSKEFFESLVKLIGFARLSQEIKQQMTYLIQTFDYIVIKEGLNNQEYIENKKILTNYLIFKEKPQLSNEFQEVNSVIFSNQLYKIQKILSVYEIEIGSQKEIHNCLGRIYFAAHSKSRSNYSRKVFHNLKYNGRDMIHNLFNYYINKDIEGKKKKDLFNQKEESENPLFAFIMNYMQLLFMPIFQQFQQIFEQEVISVYSDDKETFYNNIEKPIKEIFVPFIASLPSEFTNIFTEFYQLIKNSNAFADISTKPIEPLKMLFTNRFFFNQNLMNLVKPNLNRTSVFEESANKFNYLFYNKKDLHQYQSYVESSALIRQAFEDMVFNYDKNDVLDIYSYYITEPQLRSDYQFLYEIIKILKFSGFEEKTFEMKLYKRLLPVRKGKEEDNQYQDLMKLQLKIAQNSNKSQIEQMQIKNLLGDQNYQQHIEKKNIMESNKVKQLISIQEEASDTPVTKGVKPKQDEETLKPQSNLKKPLENINPNFQQKYEDQSIVVYKQEAINKLIQKQEEPQKFIEKELIQKKEQPVQTEQIQIFQQVYQEKSSQQLLDEKNKYIKLREELQKEKKEKIEMDNQIIELFQQISNLNDSNNFLKDAIKARYPEQIFLEQEIDCHQNIDTWKKQKQLDEERKQRKYQQQQRRNKEEDEFFKIHNRLKGIQEEITQDSITQELHKKLTLGMI